MCAVGDPTTNMLQATVEGKLRKAEKQLRLVLFRERVCKHLTPQQLHALVQETLVRVPWGPPLLSDERGWWPGLDPPPPLYS